MADIQVIGAGLGGLSTALLLARDGHTVTVLERDPAEPIGDSETLWTGWQRPGVNQFTQLHFMLPRWTATLAEELPEVYDELLSRGARRVNLLRLRGERLTGPDEPTDARFETLTARRPVLEAALAAVAARSPGISIQRGLRVTGLRIRSGAGGIPQVGGVLDDAGRCGAADLVVDAGGRRSPVPRLLETIGRAPRQEREQSGFVYYARHFRSHTAQLPACRGPLLQHLHGFSVLTLPADGDTWGVAFVTSSADRSLRGLREPSAWSRAAASLPTVRDWCVAEPITGVQVIAGIEDRLRHDVVGDEPVCTGLVAVGDAWAATNPSLGRGAAIGLLHAVALRDHLRKVPLDEAEKLVRRFQEVTASTIEPWYRATLAFDRHRLAEIDADIAGVRYRTADPSWAMTTALAAAAERDPSALRVQTAIAGMLTMPQEALAAPGVLDKVIALGMNAPRYSPRAPRHDELAALVGGRIPDDSGRPTAA